ncbi:ribosomal RNA large subunit methyltransferase J [Geopyxis carbonaria]|nr:ribosomal RNA large subunit methyltransferase J [Geopyxis carbonaria]
MSVLTLRTIARYTASLLHSDKPFTTPCRAATSASSQRWLTRQKADPHARAAALAGLRSRAAFKLLSLNERHRIFARGQTVVDLGFAPGSWSQVAIAKTAPGGRVLGVDVIPALPPKGVSTIQGDFLAASTQAHIRAFLAEAPARGGRVVVHGSEAEAAAAEAEAEAEAEATEGEEEEGEGVKEGREAEEVGGEEGGGEGKEGGKGEGEREAGDAKRSVDVVLSDMCEPWPLLVKYPNSLSAPWRRMMNTSGIAFRDHAGSIDLCTSALLFALDTLRPGGTFVCKFYQGAEDGALERKLKRCFARVHREKPDSSRKESREMYFVALGLKRGVGRGSLEGMP